MSKELYGMDIHFYSAATCSIKKHVLFHSSWHHGRKICTLIPLYCISVAPWTMDMCPHRYPPLAGEGWIKVNIVAILCLHMFYHPTSTYFIVSYIRCGWYWISCLPRNIYMMIRQCLNLPFSNSRFFALWEACPPSHNINNINKLCINIAAFLVLSHGFWWLFALFLVSSFLFLGVYAVCHFVLIRVSM